MEDYKKILAISGKPGLFKLVGQMKNGIVAEALSDKKRFPVYMSENTSSLEDISIYTEEGEVPLKEVLEKMHKHFSGKAHAISMKDAKKVTDAFSKILPKYDKERVYTSDIKKVLRWYNTLIEADLLILETKTKKKSDKKEADTTKEATTKKSTAAKKKNPPKKVNTKVQSKKTGAVKTPVKK